MSNLLIRSELFMSAAKDAPSMLAQHHEEVEDQRLPLVPDYNLFMSLEQQQMLHVFTARDDGKLVGYNVYTTTPTLHHQTTKVAVCDSIYVLPSYRGTWVGVKLIKFAETVLKDKGVSVVMMNAKSKHDFGSMLNRLGYAQTEVQYTKHLGD